MQCKYFNQTTNSQCKAHATNDGFCFSHSSTYVKAKSLAVKKGGLNRKHYEVYGQELIIESVEDIKNLLGSVINGVWTGKIPCSEPANSIAYLARCWLDCYEKSVLENKIKDIEEKIG